MTERHGDLTVTLLALSLCVLTSLLGHQAGFVPFFFFFLDRGQKVCSLLSHTLHPTYRLSLNPLAPSISLIIFRSICTSRPYSSHLSLCWMLLSGPMFFAFALASVLCCCVLLSIRLSSLFPSASEHWRSLAPFARFPPLLPIHLSLPCFLACYLHCPLSPPAALTFLSLPLCELLHQLQLIHFFLAASQWVPLFCPCLCLFLTIVVLPQFAWSVAFILLHFTLPCSFTCHLHCPLQCQASFACSFMLSLTLSSPCNICQVPHVKLSPSWSLPSLLLPPLWDGAYLLFPLWLSHPLTSLPYSVNHKHHCHTSQCHITWGVFHWWVPHIGSLFPNIWPAADPPLLAPFFCVLGIPLEQVSAFFSCSDQSWPMPPPLPLTFIRCSSTNWWHLQHFISSSAWRLSLPPLRVPWDINYLFLHSCWPPRSSAMTHEVMFFVWVQVCKSFFPPSSVLPLTLLMPSSWMPLPAQRQNQLHCCPHHLHPPHPLPLWPCGWEVWRHVQRQWQGVGFMWVE